MNLTVLAGILLAVTMAKARRASLGEKTMRAADKADEPDEAMRKAIRPASLVEKIMRAAAKADEPDKAMRKAIRPASLVEKIMRPADEADEPAGAKRANGGKRSSLEREATEPDPLTQIGLLIRRMQQVYPKVIPRKKVRLVQSRLGGKEKEGRLEVWHAGQWGTVCQDGFDDKDAAVVCRTLGWTGGSKLTYAHDYGFIGLLGPSLIGTERLQLLNLGAVGNGPVWLTQVDCAGTENNFLDCPRGDTFGELTCRHMSDVFMQCT